MQCDGEMSPVVVMDRNYKNVQQLAYRQVDDKPSFWTGSYATSGYVLSYMCGSCGRIELYGAPPEAGS
jgi:hypothetical protein